MERLIAGYHCDELGDWVATLSCGHGQHIRHRPPFQPREWVLDPDGRRRRLGTALDCPWCDRAELPEGLVWTDSSPEWDEATMPAGLRRAHRLAARTWGLICVRQGELRFVAETASDLDVVLVPGSSQAIPPEVSHKLQPLGAVRFSIDFLSVPGHDSAKSGRAEECNESADATLAVLEEGGESACFAHLLCPECGSVLDGGAHMAGCRAKADE